MIWGLTQGLSQFPSSRSGITWHLCFWTILTADTQLPLHFASQLTVKYLSRLGSPRMVSQIKSCSAPGSSLSVTSHLIWAMQKGDVLWAFGILAAFKNRPDVCCWSPSRVPSGKTCITPLPRTFRCSTSEHIYIDHYLAAHLALNT